MNKRIHELAFEANKDLDGNVPIGFAEKFAELLVKKCANHIAGQLPDERLDDWHEGYHAGVQRSIDCLKHFGVEE